MAIRAIGTIRHFNAPSSPLHLPISVLLMLMRALLSRFHLMDGNGLPLARQRNVTLEFSRTMTSLELSESSMLGGTLDGDGNCYGNCYYSINHNVDVGLTTQSTTERTTNGLLTRMLGVIAELIASARILHSVAKSTHIIFAPRAQSRTTTT